MTMSRWIDIGILDDIARQSARTVTIGTVELAVFRTDDDRVFALENRCPHKGGPLAEGIIHGDAVTCPLHNWVIDLARGEVTGPDSGCVRRFTVAVDDHGRLSLDVTALIARRSVA